MADKTTTFALIGLTAAVVILSAVLFHGCNKTVVVDTRKADSIEIAGKLHDSLFKIHADSTAFAIRELRIKDSIVNAKYIAATKETQGKSNRIIELIADVNRLKSQGTDSLKNAIDALIDQQIDLLAQLSKEHAITDSLLADKDSLVTGLVAALSQANDQVDSVVRARDALYIELQAQAKTESALVKKTKLNNLWAKVATVGLVVASLIALLKH